MSSSSLWPWSALPMAHDFEESNSLSSLSSSTAAASLEQLSNNQKPRKARRPTFAAIHASFYHRRPVTTERPPTKLVIPTDSNINDMAIEIPSDPQAGILKPVHITTEETPWTVSVAENPHDAASFSIYVKSEATLFLSIQRQRLILHLYYSSPHASPYSYSYCKRYHRSS